jgi:2,3-bisphosphoglycerate-independent phosphoglycerate mutase
MSKVLKKTFLIILDGWGHGKIPEVSAIHKANTPFIDKLYKIYPNSELVTHGLQVGLPEGQMGNSEVGHLNIGAGRVVYQDLARIHKAIEDDELAKNEKILKAINYAKSENKSIHLFGLVSDGGVHSHIFHLLALCDIFNNHDCKNVFIHAFTDGRDCDPESGYGLIKQLQNHINNTNVKIASIIGRYYAMDRDNRWERIKLAYDAMTKGKGNQTRDIFKAIQESYSNEVTDEFIQPIINSDTDGQAIGNINSGDVAFCFNFRTDRPRQITKALSQEDFPDYNMHKLDLKYLTMTRYHESFSNIDVIFEKENLANTLGEVFEKNGKTQIRIAETEKYPHVTFFFSGGREEPFKNESRIMIPSPKVPTYDLQPEMSAVELKDAIVKSINQKPADFICLNFANTDMVGHTGVIEAAVKAAETVDQCMSEIVPLALEKDYDLIVIADHGNSDLMINPDGSPHTAHTLNPVPIFYISNKSDLNDLSISDGKLADVAPTILHIMGLKIPQEMTGEILIKAI